MRCLIDWDVATIPAGEFSRCFFNGDDSGEDDAAEFTVAAAVISEVSEPRLHLSFHVLHLTILCVSLLPLAIFVQLDCYTLYSARCRDGSTPLVQLLMAEESVSRPGSKRSCSHATDEATTTSWTNNCRARLHVDCIVLHASVTRYCALRLDSPPRQAAPPALMNCMHRN